MHRINNYEIWYSLPNDFGEILMYIARTSKIRTNSLEKVLPKFYV